MNSSDRGEQHRDSPEEASVWGRNPNGGAEIGRGKINKENAIGERETSAQDRGWEHTIVLVSEMKATYQKYRGYLAHEKQPPPLGAPSGPRHSPTVGTSEIAVSYE